MADRGDYDRDRWQNEENESRNRDWERGQGRSSYDRAASERGYYGRDPDYGRSYNRGSSTSRGYGFNRSGFGSDWERSSFPLDYNRRSEQGWASDMDWDEEPVWTYSEYWWIVPGPYSGVGPQGYQRSDERLCDEVCERMSQHGHLDASNVHVDIDQGEATLTGTVNNRREKRLAEDITESVFGVKDVHNQLRIKNTQRGQTSGPGSQHSGQGSSSRGSAPVSTGYDRPDREIAANTGRSGVGIPNTGDPDAGEQTMSGPDYGSRSTSDRYSSAPSSLGQGASDQEGVRRYGDQDLSSRPEGSQGYQGAGSQNIGAQPPGGQSSDFSRWESSRGSTQVYDDQQSELRSPDMGAGDPDASSQRLNPPGSRRATISTGLPMPEAPISPSSDQPPSDVGTQPHTSRDMGDFNHESDIRTDTGRQGPEIKIDESHTATTLPSGNLRSRIQTDMDVVDRQGDPVGRVKEVRQNDFLVDRPIARDIYVPFSACQSFENEIRLNIRASEVDEQDWQLSDLFGSNAS